MLGCEVSPEGTVQGLSSTPQMQAPQEAEQGLKWPIRDLTGSSPSGRGVPWRGPGCSGKVGFCIQLGDCWSLSFLLTC